MASSSDANQLAQPGPSIICGMRMHKTQILPKIARVAQTVPYRFENVHGHYWTSDTTPLPCLRIKTPYEIKAITYYEASKRICVATSNGVVKIVNTRPKTQTNLYTPGEQIAERKMPFRSIHFWKFVGPKLFCFSNNQVTVINVNNIGTVDTSEEHNQEVDHEDKPIDFSLEGIYGYFECPEPISGVFNHFERDYIVGKSGTIYLASRLVAELSDAPTQLEQLSLCFGEIDEVFTLQVRSKRAYKQAQFLFATKEKGCAIVKVTHSEKDYIVNNAFVWEEAYITDLPGTIQWELFDNGIYYHLNCKDKIDNRKVFRKNLSDFHVTKTPNKEYVTNHKIVSFNVQNGLVICVTEVGEVEIFTINLVKKLFVIKKNHSILAVQMVNCKILLGMSNLEIVSADCDDLITEYEASTSK